MIPNLPANIPPLKVLKDHRDAIRGIHVDDRYLYSWGKGYVPEGHSYPLDMVFVYEKGRDFRLDGMLVGFGQDIFCLTSDSSRIFVGGGGGKDLTGYRFSVLRVYDKETQLLKQDEGGDEYRATALIHDGEHLYMGTSDGTIIVHDIATLREEKTLFGHRDAWTDADHLFVDQEYLYAPGSKKNVKLWDKKTLNDAASLEGHGDDVKAVISGQGRIVAACRDGTITFWDARSREKLVTVAAHVGIVHSIVMEGEHLFTCGADKTIKLWNMQTAREMLSFTANGKMATTLAIDSTHLYVGLDDGSLAIWKIGDIIGAVPPQSQNR